MRIYNTASQTIEDFHPLRPPLVTFYTCGPTVYDYTHLGHMRTFTNNDVLKKALTFLGYTVKHVMNITDVGHLTGDNDSGEDKLEKGVRGSGKTVWEVAKLYTDYFLKTMDALHISRPTILSKATEHVEDMIALIKTLEKKGYAYQTEEAVYFDVSKFKPYGKLSHQKMEEKIQKVREEVYADPEKKHPADFALWFKRIGRFKDHMMHWDSPWGDGFPGWHIECSAMSMKYLGQTIDVHAGGVDHIPIHHENEIAQSESSTGKPFVTYWFHNQFLTVEGKKMSKSLRNFYTIDDVIKKKIEPLALRLLFLQAHYRQPMNFTWEAAQGAHEAYQKLKRYVRSIKQQMQRTALSQEKLHKIDIYQTQFIEAITNDLQMPQAVAIMWEMLKSNIPSNEKLDILLEFDRVLGLQLHEVEEEAIPEEIITLIRQRQEARTSGNFSKSDELRKMIEEAGYLIEDTKQGFKIRKQ